MPGDHNPPQDLRVLDQYLPSSGCGLRIVPDRVAMDEQDARAGLAWLGRKIGWGLSPGQLDQWESAGVAVVVDQLVDPDAAGVAPRPDAFAAIDTSRDQPGGGLRQGIRSWLNTAIESPRPLETFMEFFWHDYFAVSARVVRPQSWVFDHLNLLGAHALGNFGDLLRAVTVDPAMLDFLDGGRSTRQNPNENYGRELLELYSVGVGNFTEDDVKAASRALTGWVVRRRQGTVRYVDRLHDNAPQTLLGATGVNDVDSTIEAVLAHPATAPRVVDKLAIAILGDGYDSALVADVADTFATDWELRPVVRRLIELGVAGNAMPSVLEPMAWYVTARRLPTPPPLRDPLIQYFTLGAQLPLLPPNVGGFPPPEAYLSTSATIARFNMASHLAERSAAQNPNAVAEVTEDLAGLADRLGLIDGFAPATAEALDGLQPGVGRLAAVLASPDLVVV